MTKSCKIDKIQTDYFLNVRVVSNEQEGMQEYIKFNVFIIGQNIFLYLLRYHLGQMLFQYKEKKKKYAYILEFQIPKNFKFQRLFQI